MNYPKVSRRAFMLSVAAIAAWRSNPARAALRSGVPSLHTGQIDDLLRRMTLEEKAGQLTMMRAAWIAGIAPTFNPPSGEYSFTEQLAAAVAGKLGGVFGGGGAAMALRMQQAVMAESRLKIPMIFAADVIHGYRTIFPIPLAEAASFDPQLAEQTARVAAFEAAGAGIDWTFAPMVDIARDQRWGRTMEGAGEDVLLARLFAAARVRGFQGKTLADDDAMLSCAKHFAGYGAGESGLDYNSVDLSERTLRETYLPPFEAAFTAGALSTMASFNEVSGVPSTGNPWLMRDVLRGEFGFKGFVVSDYNGDEQMIAAGFARDRRDVARIAFLAGVDMSMQSGVYVEHLPGLVRDGSVPEALVDASVRRVLEMKAMLGLFDDPFRRMNVKREQARARLPSSLALARLAAAKSIVMLKNDGNLLPLRPNVKLALIGPFASSQRDLNGPWSIYGDNAKAVNLATGVHAAMAGRGSLAVVAGCAVDEPIAGGIDSAVAAATAAEVVVLEIGESESMSGEAQSRTEITIPAAQQAVAEAVAATGTPLIVVLKNGRALALEGAVKNAPTILVGWFLGAEGGNALADILFGKVNPSGRLPVSFPISSGQEPYHYDHKATGRPNPPGALQPFKAHFRGVPNAALFPFGHGMTYGDIAYSELVIATQVMSWTGTLRVSAKITNRGQRAAEEVVQLYVRDVVASVTRPVRELKAFRKLMLLAGAEERVDFTLSRKDLEFIGLNQKPTVEPGIFELWIAPSAEAIGVHGSFELTDA